MKRMVSITAGVASLALLAACSQHHYKDHYFDKIDANGDGRISHVEMKEHAHQKLHKMDTNGDKFVSRAEFEEYKGKKHHRHDYHGDYKGHTGPHGH